MSSRVKSTVPLDRFAVINCMCGKCPVQAKSSCSEPKIKVLLGIREQLDTGSELSGMKMPSHNDLPGPYCSIGKAACSDLDLSKACICTSCPVYKKYDLGKGRPVEHFCFNGDARME